jgi:hypothetical protein
MLPAAALPQAAKKPVFSQNTWRIGLKKAPACPAVKQLFGSQLPPGASPLR